MKTKFILALTSKILPINKFRKMNQFVVLIGILFFGAVSAQTTAENEGKLKSNK